MLEDKLLIIKFNHGDRQVLQRIYDKYKVDLLTLATSLLYDKADAEDVLHDDFLSLMQSTRKLRLTDSLKIYLTVCVANRARNRNKAGKVRCCVSWDQTDDFVVQSQHPDHAATSGEQLTNLSKALVQLPYPQREGIMLHLYSGLKFKQIARIHGESINTIQGRYRYGLHKLQEILNGELK